MPVDKERKKLLHDNIQKWGTEEENLKNSLLVGWILIAEWSDGEKRCLTRTGGTEDRDLPTWQKNGYLHEALYGDWGFELDDYDPDEDDE